MLRIIDNGNFDKVQKRLEENKHGGKRTQRKLDLSVEIEDYWLTGHIYCGLCGETMQGTAGTRKSGSRHYYYSCKGHRQHKCPAKSKPKDVIERIVTYILDQIVRDPTNRLQIEEHCYAYYLQQHDDGGAYIASIQAQMHETETKINNIMLAIETGIITETTGERLKSLEAARSRLVDALEAEQMRQRCQLQLSDIVKYMDSIGGDVNDPSTQQRILDEYVERVIVTEDTIEVIMHYTQKRRVMAIKDTSKMVENQQRILGMFNGKPESKAPDATLESLTGDGG